MSKQIDIMDFPYFHGTKDPYVYVRWVQQMVEIFDSLKYFDSQKCRIASRKFFGYAADVNPSPSSWPNNFQVSNDAFKVQEGPMTRSKSKKLQEALIGLNQDKSK